MTVPIRISDAEWDVMNVLWQQAPRTAEEVAATLEGDRHPRTVKTLLNRLLAKRVVGFERHGRRYHYRPLVARDDCVRAEARSFLQRVFQGAALPMIAHLVQESRLTPAEIRELRRLLEEKR